LTRWRYAAATDVGLVRETNQDAIFADDSLAIVADGMGGHAAGEVAAAMTVDAIHKGFVQRPTVEGLLGAVETANRDVLVDAKTNPERFGMGTTVMVVGLTHDVAGVTTPTMLHVGDSRAYQLRDGALRQLSADHSVAEEWVRMGRLTPEEALTHPRRHQLTRAIGVDDNVEIDVMSLHVQAGDRILLCSDGLSNELDPDRLSELASGSGSLEETVQNLVNAARMAGGRDNISVVLLEFDDAHESERTINSTMSSAPPSVASTVPSRPRKSGPRFTWRVAAGLVVLGAVVGAFFFIMHWYAYSTYYLAQDGKYIGVYEGQPNGVLWYKPRLVVTTPYFYKHLLPPGQRSVQLTISEPSITTAEKYAHFLYGRLPQRLPQRLLPP
jgi:protein phosphatase